MGNKPTPAEVKKVMDSYQPNNGWSEESLRRYLAEQQDLIAKRHGVRTAEEVGKFIVDTSYAAGSAI